MGVCQWEICVSSPSGWPSENVVAGINELYLRIYTDDRHLFNRMSKPLMEQRENQKGSS